MALYHQYCKSRGINPDSAIFQAHPEKKAKSKWKELLSHANWQGVTYPKKWDKKEFDCLLEALAEINLHSLHAVLKEIEETEKRQNEMQKIRARKQERSRGISR